MKLGVSQRPVQSDDAVNIHPSRTELSYLSNAASRRVPSRWAVDADSNAGSEDVSKNLFFLGFSCPVPVPSGRVTGWVSSPCYAALMLMRFCGSAPVCLCGFCPADAACRWLPIYFDVLTLLLVP